MVKLTRLNILLILCSATDHVFSILFVPITYVFFPNNIIVGCLRRFRFFNTDIMEDSHISGQEYNRQKRAYEGQN